MSLFVCLNSTSYNKAFPTITIIGLNHCFDTNKGSLNSNVSNSLMKQSFFCAGAFVCILIFVVVIIMYIFLVSWNSVQSSLENVLFYSRSL